MAQNDRLTEKLRQRDFKLNALLQMTKAINANEGTRYLITQYERILREDLGIEKLVLYTRDEHWTCILKYGVGEHDIPDIPDESYFTAKGGVSLKTGRSQESFDLVIPVEQDNVPIAFLLVGDLGEQQIRMSPVIRHMPFIETLTHVLVVAIENRKLHQESVHQARVRKELELAAEMQAILLPAQLPKNEHYDVSAIYRAHQQVGGDYYDFLELGDDEVMFCMADVSGKGVSAAFLMANFQAYLRAIFTYGKQPLDRIVRELNEQVMKTALGEKYITLFLALYNRRTRSLQYVNCGHNPPVLADEHGYTQLLKLGTIGLGMFESLPKLAIGELTIPKNSTVVCYTDGLVELEDENNESFGVERLEQLMLAYHDSAASHLNEIILHSVKEFKGEMPYVDDLALLTCRLF